MTLDSTPQTSSSAPVIAIIGRPNVGKSTFFNRVLGARKAVVHDRPGITRDRNAARTEWRGRSLVFVDTGGFLPTALEGRDAVVRRQAEAAIELADAVVFMVDAKTGPTDLDAAIARGLRRRSSPCLLVVNKVDHPDAPTPDEFRRLGLGEPHPISSEGGLGIGDLLDALMAVLPEDDGAVEEELPRIAIIGRPNVGKSSLVNALLGEERVIVEAEPGTTLDAIDARWKTAKGTFILVDTAGIRRQARFDDQAEFFATVRALHALERADVACLVIDAAQGFQRQEARLVQNAFEAGRPVLLAYNKWDLVDEREQAWKAIAADRGRRFPTLADLPAIPISALTGTHVHRLADALAARVAEGQRKIATSKVNEWLKDVQRRRPVGSNRLGQTPKIYYMTQTGVGPPEFTLFVNAPSRLSEQYRRFLWLQFVDHFGFKGTPVRIRVRKSE